jgi:hypothetical protein
MIIHDHHSPGYITSYIKTTMNNELESIAVLFDMLFQLLYKDSLTTILDKCQSKWSVLRSRYHSGISRIHGRVIIFSQHARWKRRPLFPIWAVRRPDSIYTQKSYVLRLQNWFISNGYILSVLYVGDFTFCWNPRGIY